MNNIEGGGLYCILPNTLIIYPSMFKLRNSPASSCPEISSGLSWALDSGQPVVRIRPHDLLVLYKAQSLFPKNGDADIYLSSYFKPRNKICVKTAEPLPDTWKMLCEQLSLVLIMNR